MAVYELSSTFGPTMELVVTGYIGLNLGWRGIFWVLMAMTGGVWVLLVTTIPETQHTTVLENKTKRARKQMKKENVQSAESTTDLHANGRKGLHGLFAITLMRPFRFLFFGAYHVVLGNLKWLPIRIGVSFQQSNPSGFRPPERAPIQYR